MLAIIKQFVRRMLMGKGKGILQIPPQSKVDDFAKDLLKKFKQNGVPDEAITNTRDVRIIWEQITNREAAIFANNLKDVLKKSDPFKKVGEVVDLTGKKIPPGSQIMGGEEVVVDVVGDTVTQMKAMTPMDAMKEANLVIGKKGKYKNLTKEQSKKILKDTNDHIFERDIKYDEFGEIIKPDPEDLAGGGRTGYKDGFKVYPQISASKSNVPLGDGYNVDLQDLLYGGTIAYEKGPFSGGIEYLKSKNKYDFKDRDDTLQKDTTDDELLNLILKMKLESGLKARLTANKEGGTFNISKSFAGGGRTSTGLNYLLGEDDQNSRVPYGAGGMGRRLFLKLMGGAAAGTAATKSGLFSLLKSSKPVSKVITSVPIKSGVDGMPVWFKPLVNKIIKTGDEVESGMERVLVHSSELPGSKTKLYVTQELDTGNVMVDVGIGKHGFSAGHYGQPVRLEYKAAENIMSGPKDEPFKIGTMDPHVKTKTRKEFTTTDPTHVENIKRGERFKETGKPTKTKEEFWVEEAEFTGGHPENVKFEESTFEKFGEHGSNFDEVEKFATGKTTKASKKGSKQVWEADWDDSLPDYEDFASGGRVPLAGGLAGMLGE